MLTPSAQTASEPTVSAPVVAATGDIACEPGFKPGALCQHEAVSDAVLADTAIVAVLTLGDHQYSKGTLAQYMSSYDKTWGRLKNKTRPVPGNHDYMTADAKGYFDYFGTAAGNRKKGYYSYDIGTWHFVALNSERDTSMTGSQVAWLKADLNATESRCVAAYWHRPRWSSGIEYGDSDQVAPFFGVLYEANAELVLSGHEHNYERFRPLNPDGVPDDDRGLVQIVSGLGGKSQYEVRGRSETATSDSTSYGYSRLILYEDSADITYVPVIGDYTDSYHLKCH